MDHICKQISFLRARVFIMFMAAIGIMGSLDASASDLFRAEDGIDIHYSLTIEIPSNNQAKVKIDVKNISIEEFWLEEPTSIEGYAINVLDLSASDMSGNFLAVEHFNGTSDVDPYGGYPDQWKIKCSGLSEFSIEYSVTPKIIWWKFNEPTYGYISDEFAAFLAEYVFLMPSPIYSIGSATATFIVPEGWQVLTPWPQIDGVYNLMVFPPEPEYAERQWSKSVFHEGIIGIGPFELYTKKIGSAEVPVGFYGDWSVTAMEEISEIVWDLFSYQSSVWGGTLDLPYIVIFFPRISSDGREIFGGMTHTGQFFPVTNIQDGKDGIYWLAPATELSEARWLSYDWGFMEPSCRWFKAGPAMYIAWKSLLHTGIDNLDEAESRLRGIYNDYVNQYVNTNMDWAPASKEADADGNMGFWKGSLITFLMSKEIYLQSDGHFTFDDFAEYLFGKYGFTGASLQEEDIKAELFNLTGIDFTAFFNKYIYSSNPLPMDWAFEDDDGDGLSNALEIGWNTNPENEDTDDDGISDAKEIKVGSDPLDPFSGLPPICIPKARKGPRYFIPQLCMTVSISDFRFRPRLPIVIDGEDLDWDMYSPVATDPPGDTEIEGGADLKAVYLENGPYHVYIMVETYNPPLPSPGNIEFYIDSVNKSGETERINSYIPSDGSFWMSKDGEFQEVQEAVVAWGNVMELMIPKRVLRHPAEIIFFGSNVWSESAGDLPWVDWIEQ